MYDCFQDCKNLKQLPAGVQPGQAALSNYISIDPIYNSKYVYKGNVITTYHLFINILMKFWQLMYLPFHQKGYTKHKIRTVKYTYAAQPLQDYKSKKTLSTYNSVLTCLPSRSIFSMSSRKLDVYFYSEVFNRADKFGINTP